MQEPRIIIAGEDVTAAWAPALAAAAAEAERSARWQPLPPEWQALSLREAADEDDFERRYLGLLRRKLHVDTLEYEIPRRPGPFGAFMGRVRAFLWKLLRYQHDRITFRQNLVNTGAVQALEHQRDALRREVARLEKRLEAVERRLAEGDGAR